MSASMRSASKATLLALLAFLTPTDAVFVAFDNCLSAGYQTQQPLLLQWVPLYVNARFDTAGSGHNLNLRLYGNVSGKQFDAPYPPPNDPIWTDNNDTFGKITNLTRDRLGITAQESKVTFLDYNAWSSPTSVFCNSEFENGGCPLGPLFNASATNPDQLHAFTVQQDLNSSYAFTTLTATITIRTGDTPAQPLGCISASITPDLGSRLRALLTWLPAVILILKAVSTITAAIWSPWGSTDIFRWSSNYGRDEDLLRLVTPGFGDCLQYIQFIMLTGSLSLAYPGYFQPAVANTAWSCLLFNESFVSHGPGSRSLIDGIYSTNGTYGMGKMSQLVGMTEITDIWACMAVWLAVITLVVIVLCQLGFLSRFVYRKTTKTTEEDLRAKNLPFTIGNLIRLLFNYFILPIVALSFFQLVLAGQSPVSVVAMSAILLVIMILSAAWIMRVIFRTKPRTFLFDDMPTVLLYGPLYNTYSDSAAPFALLPVLITFMRGVAIGAVQPSGVAQIAILAICEVILILTLNGLRPFQGLTSMNLQHTVYSMVRLMTVLLQIAFVPRLGITEGPKGWVGYVILILHACVLVFGFLLNSAQTLFEVVARAFGVGGNSQGVVRGSILTFRMLKKRQNRSAAGDRQSLMSTTAILRHNDEFDPVRSRSMSASSQQLLRQGGRTPSAHRLSGFENVSSIGEAMSPLGDNESTAYFGAHGRAPSKRSADITNATENFYRPPRQRRGTGDLMNPGAKSRPSHGSVDFPYSDSPGQKSRGVSYGSYKRESPAAAYMRDRADSNADLEPRTDYAVREVDQYYRGEPLATGAPRKLKTGPADPQSPAATAQSWFQRVFGGGNKHQKDKGKGFEVVRSTRAPPELQQQPHEDYEMVSPPPQEPYTDSPGEDTQAVSGAQQDSTAAHGFDFGLPREESSAPVLASTHPALRPSMDSNRDQHPGMRAEMPRSRAGSVERPLQHVSEVPTLSPIESIGGIDLPSRFNSRASTTGEPGRDWLSAVDRLSWPDHARDSVPHVPERSVRRPASPTGPPIAGTFSPIEEHIVSPIEDDFDDERPASFKVSKHRAADSITRNSFGAGQIASAAELHGAEPEQRQ